MNIVQLQAKTMFFLDGERSPRFKTSQVDKALNTAINDILLDRYNNIHKTGKEKEYAFQTSQRLRDELYTLVRYVSSLGVTQPDLVPSAGFPTDYMFMLILEAIISGQTINTIPITYDELNVIELNPYFRPSITWPQRIYRIESNDGAKIKFGDRGMLTSANMYYIAKPAKVSIGTEESTGTVTFYAGTSVIAYVDSVLNLYNAAGVLIGTYDLAEEEKYTVAGGVDHVILSSGIVYYNFTECDLPEALHEEICRKAAKILSGNVENYNREKSLESDLNK